MSEQLWQYTAINGHPEDMQRNVRASDGSIIGEWAPVEPAARITVTEENATDVSVLEHGRYVIVRLDDACTENHTPTLYALAPRAIHDDPCECWVEVEPAARITVTEENATYLDVSVLEHGRYVIVRLDDA